MIVLAVLLVAGIIAMINSIPLSIRTIYSYSREVLGVTPRGDPTQTERIVREIKLRSPVPIERVMICRATGTQVNSIVGNFPFIVLGLKAEDMQWYLERQRTRAVIGRLPEKGAPEAVISQPVAKNLGLKLGDVLLGPELSESYSPMEVKVVGIGLTERWYMLTSIEYQRQHHFPPIDFAMVAARNLEDQSKLDRWAEERFKGERAQMWAFHQIERNSNEMFATLYQILNVVIGTLALVITIMMGMLMNIYQSQRLVEFALLQAIGYTRRQLLSRVILESIAVVVLGWVLGVVAAYGLLNLAKKIMLDPKAYSLDPMDLGAYAYTIPVPLAILVVALLTVALRFRKFDPVGVVERRLV